MKTLIFRFSIILIAGLIVWGCKKDDVPEEEPIIIKEATDVNKFIFNGLSTWYLWVDNVPNLTNSKFNNNDTLNAFLNKYKDPEELFYSLLYKYNTIDKWSFIVDDSKQIDDWIAGISETMGYDFGLGYINSQVDDKIVGFVRYVIKDSPADKAGVKRGDLFLTINGQQLTASNYQNLLFSNKTYTVGFASYQGGSNFTLTGKTATLTAVTLQENPIYMDTIFTINGNKVGYLVYNAFNNSFDETINSSYDIELNKVFGKFKNAGIQKLILDLRYNGGGSIQTTVYLASMIHSIDTKKILLRTQYNNIVYDYYKQQYGNDVFNDYFENKIYQTAKTPETPINSLGLNELYVIATNYTSSASELLINGLKPYMTVKQVGTNTSGKYVGSVTLKDYIDNNGTVNPNHKWAMQPIVLKTLNSAGVSDYVNGLTPTIEAQEYAVEFLPFGDPNEALLKACIDDIRGTKSAKIYAGPRIKELKIPDELLPNPRTMFMDTEKTKKLFLSQN